MKLIDADALIKALGITDMNCERCAWYSGIEWNPCKRGSDFEQACFEIENAPEAVVRCKDCRYAKITIDGKYCKYCTFLMDNFGICDAIYFEADYFCGSGERKTE